MMRIVRLILAFLGLIPFIWFVAFLVTLSIGIIKLGYIPQEGDLNDPYKLGLDWINIFLGIWGLFAYLAFYVWIITAISFFAYFRDKKMFNRKATVLFIIAVAGVLIFEYLFPGVFGWVLD
jgi:hypothetical protein